MSNFFKPILILNKKERKLLKIKGHYSCGCYIYFKEDYPLIKKGL